MILAAEISPAVFDGFALGKIHPTVPACNHALRQLVVRDRPLPDARYPFDHEVDDQPQNNKEDELAQSGARGSKTCSVSQRAL